MQLPVSAALLALPMLAAAEGPFEQYKAQFQNFMDSFGSFVPNPNRYDPAEAHSAKTGDKHMSILTLSNWKPVLYEPVKAGATTPEEWWVLVTGGNKTCFGRCGQFEAAFNETAAKFATLPEKPHLGYINCEDQPILCTSWSASPGSIWIIDMLPPDAPEIDIHKKYFNLTTVTSQEILDLYASTRESKKDLYLNETIFHPFNSWVAKNGLTVAVGYFFWFFNLVPSWLFMLVVSFISRGMMTRRMDRATQRTAAAEAAARRRGAPPGDARS